MDMFITLVITFKFHGMFESSNSRTWVELMGPEHSATTLIYSHHRSTAATRLAAGGTQASRVEQSLGDPGSLHGFYHRLACMDGMCLSERTQEMEVR